MLTINHNLDSTDTFSLVIHNFTWDRETNNLESFKLNWWTLNLDFNKIWLNMELWLIFAVHSNNLICSWLHIGELVNSLWVSLNILKGSLRFFSYLGFSLVKIDVYIWHRVVVGNNFALNWESWDFKEIFLAFESCFPFKLAVYLFLLVTKISIRVDFKDICIWNRNIFEFYLA